MPTKVQVTFSQKAMRNAAIAAIFKMPKERIRLDFDEYGDKQMFGYHYKLICGENSIPDAIVLKCEYPGWDQKPLEHKYMLVTLRDGTWCIDNSDGVDWDYFEERRDPTLDELRSEGLFDLNNT